MTDPTPAPLPIDISGIATPLPDAGHEAIRAAAHQAVLVVWSAHQQLLAAVTDLQAQVSDLQAQVAALTPAPNP